MKNIGKIDLISIILFFNLMKLLNLLIWMFYFKQSFTRFYRGIYVFVWFNPRQKKFQNWNVLYLVFHYLWRYWKTSHKVIFSVSERNFIKTTIVIKYMVKRIRLLLLNQVVFKFWRIQILWRMLKPLLCLMLLCLFSLVLG